jgi:hypothetical protein
MIVLFTVTGAAVLVSGCTPGATRPAGILKTRWARPTGTETGNQLGTWTTAGMRGTGTVSATAAMLKSMTGTGTGAMAAASAGELARAFGTPIGAGALPLVLLTEP